MPSEGSIPAGGSGLRRDCLGFWEVFAQSIANIAPTATPALVIPLAFAVVGNMTWAIYVFATVALLLVTYQINQFARRSASPGSLYMYVGKGLGPSWGVITGWSQVIAYVVIGAAVVAGAANYVGVLVHFVVKGYDGPLTVASIILVALAAWYIAYRDIKLSTQVMLVMEFISVALILVLALGFFIKRGHLVDHAQFSLAGFNTRGIPQGIILAIFSYVGFESATALGHEAKDPLTTVPRAIPLSLITIGAFFGPTLRKGGDLARFQSWGAPRAGGYVCPFLRCPRCDGDLLWRTADVDSGVEALHFRLDKPANRPRDDRLAPLPSPCGLARVESGVAHDAVQEGHDGARRLPQRDQFQERFLNHVFGRVAPLPRVQEQRRAVGIQQAREVVWAHHSY